MKQQLKVLKVRKLVVKPLVVKTNVRAGVD